MKFDFIIDDSERDNYKKIRFAPRNDEMSAYFSRHCERSVAIQKTQIDVSHSV